MIFFSGKVGYFPESIKIRSLNCVPELTEFVLA